LDKKIKHIVTLITEAVYEGSDDSLRDEAACKKVFDTMKD
jgi:hypothetical protein